jgi:hypothetical protein
MTDVTQPSVKAIFKPQRDGLKIENQSRPGTAPEERPVEGCLQAAPPELFVFY